MSPTIALIDDDRNILASVSIALEAEGFAVRTFTDGSDAIKSLAVQPVDLIVLDIKMPRMDGMEVLNRLRQKTETLPVIFLTSKDDEVDDQTFALVEHTAGLGLLCKFCPGLFIFFFLSASFTCSNIFFFLHCLNRSKGSF